MCNIYNFILQQLFIGFHVFFYIFHRYLSICLHYIQLKGLTALTRNEKVLFGYIAVSNLIFEKLVFSALEIKPKRLLHVYIKSFSSSLLLQKCIESSNHWGFSRTLNNRSVSSLSAFHLFTHLSITSSGGFTLLIISQLTFSTMKQFDLPQTHLKRLCQLYVSVLCVLDG